MDELANSWVQHYNVLKTIAAAAACATAAAGGGAAGSAGSAAGAEGAGGATGSTGGAAGAGRATGSAGGAAGVEGAGPTTDRHCLSWPLSRQLQQLGVDSGGHCLSQTTPPLSSFASGFFSEPIQVVEALVFYVLQRGGSSYESAAALGASESAAALGASEFAADSGARASPATVVARTSTVLPCPAVPSGSLSDLHLPTFLTNLVGNAAIQDVWVDTFIPGRQRVAICTCSRTGRHLATFTRRPGSSLYTLNNASTQVAEAGQVAAPSQVSASGQLAASCSCRVLSHQTLLWHHRLDHPSLPCLRGMHSRLLVSGLPSSLPSLLCSPALPCLPCVDGRQRAAPHSSEFPPTTAPLQTLHADVSGVLIPWIRATCRQLRERFSRDFPVLHLHSKRGGEFSSDLLAEFCQDEGIVQSFMLLASPQQNGIAERRIGLIMEVARTSMIHAAAPHFLWSFAVQYAAHQLNLWPRVSEPETSPTFQWTGKVGDASVFRVWGALSLVRDAKGPALSVVSQVDPPPLVEPSEVSSDSSGSAEGDDPAADDTAATRLETPPGFPPRPSSPPPGAGSWGAATGGADSGGPASPSGGGAVGDPAGGPGAGQPPQPNLLGTLSPQAIRTWIVRRGSPGGGGYGPAGIGAAIRGDIAGAGGNGGTAGAGGAAGAGGTRGAAGAGGAGATSPRGAIGPRGAGPTSPRGTAGAGGAAGARGAGAGGTGGAGAAGPGGTRTRGTGAARAGGAAGAGGAGGATGAIGTGGAGGTTGARVPGSARASGAAGAGGATRAAGVGAAGTALHIPFFYPQLKSSLPPPDSPQLLPALAPHTEVTESLTERREPETRASTHVRARRVARPCPPAVPGTHGMALRPSSVPQHVVLLEPPASSLPHVPNPESDLARATSPTVCRLLATIVTNPYLESTTAFALTELVDFAARSRLNYVTSLVTGSEQFEIECLAATLSRFASMLLCPEGDPDALDIPTPRSYAEAIAGEYSSQWQTAMDAEMASYKSTGTYADEVPPPWANIVDGMWIFRVKRPPGSPPAFKARYVAPGFSQQEGVDFFQTFSPTLKITTLRVLLHVAAQRDYKQHSLAFSTAFPQGSLHEEIRLRRPTGFTGTTLAALGFAPSSANPSLFLRTDTTVPPFYVLVYPTPLSTGHSLSAPPSDESVEPSGLYLELVGCLILGSGSVLWRSTRSSSVLSLSCDAEIFAGAMAAQELRWLTYLLTDLRERPRSPPRGQLRLSYVASRANTADVFTKALGSGDHQRFCTALGLVPTLPHLLVA
ncbi:unnamed protein product [Closterium sp. NIES-53]